MEQQQQQTYEDILDVQVIAKMQEESLRQSVMNINRHPNQEMLLQHQQQQQQKQTVSSRQPRANYNTATITKRVHSNRPSINHMSNNIDDVQYNSMRNDSISSEHSSISSTASNYESPYTSHVNVNASRQTPQRDLRQNPNYQTITKSKTINNGISSAIQQRLNVVNKQVVSRSNTPSKTSFKDESRLPTPRSSRPSVDRSIGNVLINTNSPSKVVNLSKPPPAPAQTPANSSSSTRRVLAYGSKRSLTTSIVPSASSVKSNLIPAVSNRIQNQNQETKKSSTNLTNVNRATNAGQNKQKYSSGISSSTSTNTIASTHSVTSTTSPSNLSSISNSSSINQIAPINASSPRSADIISPSGLLTDGPLNRKSNSNNVRDRSSSPSTYSFNAPANKLGSNSNLSSIQGSANLTQTPFILKQQQQQLQQQQRQQQTRRSFLPQPVQYSQRRPSVSPIRLASNQLMTQGDSSWQDELY